MESLHSKSKRFIDSSVKVNISSIVNLDAANSNDFNSSNPNKIRAKCVRCEHMLDESESLFITVHPAIKNPQFTLGTDCLGSIKDAHTKETFNSFCSLESSKTVHPSNIQDAYTSGTNISCYDFEPLKSMCCSNTKGPYTNEADFSCWDLEVSKSICLCPESSSNAIATNDICETNRNRSASLQDASHCHDRHCDKAVSRADCRPVINLCSSVPCADCHIALVLNCPEKQSDGKLSLMLQVSEKPTSVQKEDKAIQTELMYEVSPNPSLVNIGVETSLPSIPFVYPEIATVSNYGESSSGGPLEGYSTEDLPEASAENLAAYEAHKQSLVPCSYCGRRFNPDRVMVHQKACIEGPKQ